MQIARFSQRLNRFMAVALVMGLALALTLGSLAMTGQAAAAPAIDLTATLVGARPVGFSGGTFICGDWNVSVPAGRAPDGSLIHCGRFGPDAAPAGPAGFKLLRHTVNINLYDNNGQWIPNFEPPLNFCYTYADSDLAAAGGDVRNFTVMRAPVGGVWTILVSEITPATRQVCAHSDHLTLFDLAVKSGASTNLVIAATPVVQTVSSAGGPFTSTSRYIVQAGDNLFRIALRYNTTVLSIQAANGLSSTFIYVGEALVIPGGSQPAAPTASPTARPAATLAVTETPSPKPNTYVVQHGDNLFRLAIRFNTTVAALQAANRLTSTFIYAGEILTIPGK
jgi:LysM repeat protein